MNKDNLVKDVLSLIHNQNIENEIREALSLKPLKQREKTSDDFEIYYDQASGEAVGIVHKNIVFLKHVSDKDMSWNDAVAYCETVVINGIRAQLCPAGKNWPTEFKKISKELWLALKEIGAEKLDYWTWASKYNGNYAWYQNFLSGGVGKDYKNLNFYVRPVLLLH